MAYLEENDSKILIFVISYGTINLRSIKFKFVYASYITLIIVGWRGGATVGRRTQEIKRS